jgi:hypothetical protein
MTKFGNEGARSLTSVCAIAGTRHGAALMGVTASFNIAEPSFVQDLNKEPTEGIGQS